MTDAPAPTYGEKVSPEDVSYEAAHYAAGTTEPGYYYLVSDEKQRVVWVQPTSEVGVDTRGWFALYTGGPEDYQAVVDEAA